MNKTKRYSFVRNPKFLPILPEEPKGIILMSEVDLKIEMISKVKRTAKMKTTPQMKTTKSD